MKAPKSLYHRHRFPPQIIQYAIWLYHRFSFSYRDIEDLLAERANPRYQYLSNLWSSIGTMEEPPSSN